MKYIPRCSSIIIQYNYRVLLGVRREAERVPAEAGALRRERAALADLVCRLADADPAIGLVCGLTDADSGIAFNASLIDLEGLGDLDAVTGVGVDLTFLTGRLLRVLLFLSRFTTEVWTFVFLVGDALLFLSRFTTGVWTFVFLVDALLFLSRFSATFLIAARAALPRVCFSVLSALAAFLAAAFLFASSFVARRVACAFLIRSFAAFSRNICFCLCLSLNRNFL